uniref:SAP domain-containing protein n=1 Tax=Strongyloides stercoralis TaxID=6248 RepID=A0A0K0DV57_STRER
MESLTGLTYNEIRSKCKSYGLKANGKKTDLITRLTNYLTELTIDSDHQNNVKTIENKEKYQMFLTDDEDEDFVEEKPVNTLKNEKSKILPSSEALKEVNSLSTEIKVDRNIPQTYDMRKNENNKVEQPLNATVDYMSSDEEVFQKIDKQKTLIKEKEDRFSRQHKKIFNKAESIVERHERIKELHAKHEASVPEAFKRLATPKRISIARRSTFLNDSKPGFDFSKAPLDTSKVSHAFDRTPARNFDTPKVGVEVNEMKKFQEKKKEMSLLHNLSSTFKKSGGNFSNNREVNKKKFNTFDRKKKNIVLPSKKVVEERVKKITSIRNSTALKRERQLNAKRE